MAVRDTFQWWNPGDWFGAHDEQSIFKSADVNRDIRWNTGTETARDRADRDARDRRDRQFDLRSERRESSRSRNRAVQEQMAEDRKSALKSADKWGDRAYDVGQENLAYTRAQVLEAVKRGELTEERALEQLNRNRGIWQRIYSEQEDKLTGLQGVQAQLRQEVREAPSSVMEQARQSYDRELGQSASLAAIGGRSASGADASLRNLAATRSADLLSRTAVARSDEHLKRLGMQSDLAGREAGLSQSILGIGKDYQGFDVAAASLQRGLGQDIQSARLQGASTAGNVGSNLVNSILGAGGLDQGAYGLALKSNLADLDREKLELSYADLALDRDRFNWQRDYLERKFDWSQQDRDNRMLGGALGGIGAAAKSGGAGSVIGGTIGGIGGFFLGGPAGAMKGASLGATGGGLVDKWFGSGTKQTATPAFKPPVSNSFKPRSQVLNSESGQLFKPVWE